MKGTLMQLMKILSLVPFIHTHLLCIVTQYFHWKVLNLSAYIFSTNYMYVLFSGVLVAFNAIMVLNMGHYISVHDRSLSPSLPPFFPFLSTPL